MTADSINSDWWHIKRLFIILALYKIYDKSRRCSSVECYDKSKIFYLAAGKSIQHCISKFTSSLSTYCIAEDIVITSVPLNFPFTGKSTLCNVLSPQEFKAK